MRLTGKRLPRPFHASDIPGTKRLLEPVKPLVSAPVLEESTFAGLDREEGPAYIM